MQIEPEPQTGKVKEHEAREGMQIGDIVDADGLDDLGELAEAKQSLEEAVAAYEGIGAAAHDGLGMARNNLAWVHHRLGDYSVALALYRDALKIRDSRSTIRNSVSPAHAGFFLLQNPLVFQALPVTR